MLRESALVIFACGMRLGGVLGRGVCACLFDDPCADRVLEGREEFKVQTCGLNMMGAVLGKDSTHMLSTLRSHIEA